MSKMIGKAEVQLLTSQGDGPMRVKVVGHYASLNEAIDAAKQACGDASAEGKATSGSTRERGLTYQGPNGVASVGWLMP